MYEPKIIGYLCTWCSYTGADTAGTARLKYPSNLRVVRVPCSGRVSPELIMRTFDQGAEGVLVLGCHIGECHYDTGNHRAAKRLPILQKLMEFAGLEPERLRLDWVSASEGDRFARIVNEFTEAVRAQGPCQWTMISRRLPVIRHPLSAISELDSALGGQPARITDHGSLFTDSIRAKARELLSTGQVECVIGYEVGPRGRTRPAFVYQPDDVERLVWNRACTHNLTAYLREKLYATKPGTPRKRVAVVVKPCDSRAINVLLAEQQFLREQVHVIGLACEGIVEGAGFEPVSEGQLQARCARCIDRMPVVYDTLIGEPPEVGQVSNLSHDLAQLEAMTPAERAGFWLSQFDRCIRCNACRQVCPMCNCPTCLYERDDSLWAGMGIEPSEKRTFHLGRAYHLAGRCVGCNECERVCPMKIPISLLNRKLAKEVEGAFGHRAGGAPMPSPFVTILSGEEVRP